MDLQLVADEENEDRAECGKDEAGGMVTFVRRRANMWVTAPPMMEPMIPSTIVQKIVMCACMTDLASTPAMRPTRIQGKKWGRVYIF